MTSELVALSWDANDPRRLAGFWSALLGWEQAVDGSDAVILRPNDDSGFGLRFVSTDIAKVEQNHMHLDLTSRTRPGQQQTVATAIELGARPVDVGQRSDEPHVVLADPEGNEFCVIEPGNNFLADCGFVGAVAGDGSQAAGYFWSAALGWPIVWDQDQETAIRSPRGGPKITWGGPPFRPATGHDRLHFELVAVGDPWQEVDRLVGLGARVLRDTRDDSESIALADPDGREFRLWPAAGG